MGSGNKGPYPTRLPRKENGSYSSSGSIAGIEEAREASQMPNYQKAVTPIEKFTRYSLDPTNPNNAEKAYSYEHGLGYTKANAEELRSRIHKAVTSGEYVPFESKADIYGVKYRYRIPITGPNGKTLNVIAVYQIDHGKKDPRMVTNYIDNQKKQKKHRKEKSK